MLRAVTAPALPVLPCARTQPPTLTSEAVPLPVLAAVVPEPTITHDPPATSASFALTCLLKIVAPFQVTATCPSWAFWTCAVEPETAATLPVAPGNRPLPAAPWKVLSGPPPWAPLPEPLPL